MNRLLLLLVLAALWTGTSLRNAGPPRVAEETAPSVARSARWAPPDTALRHDVQAGEVLIFALPRTAGPDTVARYDVVRAPALSWLVGTSFFWRTQPRDAGAHQLLFRATYLNAPPDTLAVQVEVTP